MTSATVQARPDVDDVNIDISNRVEHVRARDGAWRRMGCVISHTETLSGAWGCMQSPTASKLSRVCRSAQDDLYGTFKTLIKAMFAAVMQTAVICVV